MSNIGYNEMIFRSAAHSLRHAKRKGKLADFKGAAALADIAAFLFEAMAEECKESGFDSTDGARELLRDALKVWDEERGESDDQ